MKLYVDSNIYLDFLLKRKNKKFKDLSQKAYIVFKRTIQCEFEIIISDHVLFELKKNLDPSKAKILFYLLDKKLIKIKTTDEDKIKAKQLDTHFADALHIILAKKANADIIITRNKKDFDGLFNSKLPEDI